MRLLDELLASLQGDWPVLDLRIGLFVTAVLSRSGGLATTVQSPRESHGTPAMPDAGKLPRDSARALADWAKRDDHLQRSVGIAALNSMLDVDEKRCVELNAGDWLMEQGRGRRVAVVGHFPFVTRLRQSIRHLDVLELNPGPDDVPAELAAEVIPKADIVAITGSALVNGTIESLLALCRPHSTVAVLGPSTPLSTVWFDHGVNVVSGTRVVDAEAALRSVSEGAIFRQLRGVQLLTMMRDVDGGL